MNFRILLLLLCISRLGYSQDIKFSEEGYIISLSVQGDEYVSGYVSYFFSKEEPQLNSEDFNFILTDTNYTLLGYSTYLQIQILKNSNKNLELLDSVKVISECRRGELLVRVLKCSIFYQEKKYSFESFYNRDKTSLSGPIHGYYGVDKKDKREVLIYEPLLIY